MLDHSAQSGTHSLLERGSDFYPTSPQAVHALLRVEKLPYQIWDPACGGGGIARVLRGAGHAVYASDLNDWGYLKMEPPIPLLELVRQRRERADRMQEEMIRQYGWVDNSTGGGRDGD